MRSYLRFDVSGLSGSITSAKLRIYPNSSSGSSLVSWFIMDNSWGETTITYANAPALPGSSESSAGPVAAGAWIELDVTALVSGDGTYSFAVTTPGSTAISLASRNASVNQPELVIQTQ